MKVLAVRNSALLGFVFSLVSLVWQMSVSPDAQAQALFVEMRGYFRLHSTYLYNSLPADLPEKNIGFLSQRFRLEPAVMVEERVRVQAQVDVLDHLVWGSTHFSGPVFNPAYDAYSYFSILGDEQEAILVKRVWVEVNSPYGIFNIGRQPWEWGLGVFINSGDGRDFGLGDPNYGETRDRLSYQSPPMPFLGDLRLLVAYDKLIEDLDQTPSSQKEGIEWLADPTDDMDEWVVALSRKVEGWESGAGFRRRLINRTATRLWNLNFYSRYRYRSFYAEGEMQYSSGKTKDSGQKKLGVEAWGGMLRLGANPHLKESEFNFGIETGFASGDEKGDGARATYFAPDYRVDLILYSQLIDYLTRLNSSPRLTLGGVTNSIYVRPYFFYLYPRWVEVVAGILWAYPDDVDGVVVGRDSWLGLEVDGGVRLKVSQRVSAGIEMGYLFVGDGLARDFNNPFAIRGKFQVIF